MWLETYRQDCVMSKNFRNKIILISKRQYGNYIGMVTWLLLVEWWDTSANCESQLFYYPPLSIIRLGHFSYQAWRKVLINSDLSRDIGCLIGFLGLREWYPCCYCFILQIMFSVSSLHHCHMNNVWCMCASEQCFLQRHFHIEN